MHFIQCKQGKPVPTGEESSVAAWRSATCRTGDQDQLAPWKPPQPYCSNCISVECRSRLTSSDFAMSYQVNYERCSPQITERGEIQTTAGCSIAAIAGVAIFKDVHADRGRDLAETRTPAEH